MTPQVNRPVWQGVAGGAPGCRRPARRCGYFLSVSGMSLFAGLPCVGENSMLRLSLIRPLALSAARPAGVGLSVSVTGPALDAVALPLQTSGLGVPVAVIVR